MHHLHHASQVIFFRLGRHRRIIETGALRLMRRDINNKKFIYKSD